MSARGEFDLWVPRRVGGLLALAFGAARKAAGRWLSPRPGSRVTASPAGARGAR